MKNWLAALSVLVLLGAPSSASAAFRLDFDDGVDVKKAIQAVKQAAGEREDDGSFRLKGTREWTIMVYINAKNNLEAYGLSDVNEMEAVGSDDKVGVVVELGRIKGYSSEDGDWKTTRRYLIQKDDDRTKITSPILQEIVKSDMGDWNHLVEFTAWARKTAPAKRYMLIVWNHGSGWDRLGRNGDFWTTGISYDDETGNHISTADLGKAMAAIGHVEIYASDACLMQMAEVDYQIKDFADIIVGSEETEPADGYDYQLMLSRLAEKPSADPAEVGRITAEAYRDSYAKRGMPAIQSAVYAASMKPLLAKLDAWSAKVMAANEAEVIKSAMKSVQDFYYSSNKDLYHFIQLVTEGTKDAGLKAEGQGLMKFISEDLVAANATYGSNYQNAFGLAVYLPAYWYNDDYDKLTWSQEGAWDEFAKWVKETNK